MEKFMQRALELGAEALQAQEVPVGCVFVIDNKIVAESRNSVNETRNPTRHAEINCIDFVLEYCKCNNIGYDYFKKISVYVTVEPCIMCASALNNIGIKNIFYGCANDRFGSKTVIDVVSTYQCNYNLLGNILADDAMILLKQFYKGTNPLAPDINKNKKKS